MEEHSQPDAAGELGEGLMPEVATDAYDDPDDEGDAFIDGPGSGP
jgi:hypothetical protein